jgi:hypothetical protein
MCSSVMIDALNFLHASGFLRRAKSALTRFDCDYNTISLIKL